MDADRPVGVVSRVRQAYAAERAIRDAEPRWALRRALTDFFAACGYHTVFEVPASKVSSAARVVVELLDDVGQLRTGTAYEDSCLRCAREHVTTYAAGSDNDDDVAVRALIAQVMAGFGWSSGEPHAGLGFVCLHQAESVRENIQRPYLAATAIRTFRLYEPDDPFGICEPMRRWCVRWEDGVGSRGEIAEEISAALDEFLVRHPSGGR